MPKRAALYLRVSTGEQTTENQRRELEDVAQRSGWEIVAVYEDAGVSGARGRDMRPAFDKLNKDAARRKFDVVMAWSVDRLGRSLQDFVAFLNELQMRRRGKIILGKMYTAGKSFSERCIRRTSARTNQPQRAETSRGSRD